MRTISTLALLTLALIAAPLTAYTVYLKDGTRIIARDKYEVEEGRAIIVLPNGTQTFIDAAQIDVPRTEAANQGSYGTALTLEGGNLTETPSAPPDQGPASLSDYIARREPAARERPQARRPGSAGSIGTDPNRTSGGFVDLITFPRAPFRDLELATEIRAAFRNHGLEQLQIYQGTRPERPLLEITTNSEASVFRGLESAAGALLDLLAARPGAVSSFEVVMTTSDQERAGQFLLAEEDARLLADKQVETATFFTQQVQF